MANTIAKRYNSSISEESKATVTVATSTLRPLETEVLSYSNDSESTPGGDFRSFPMHELSPENKQLIVPQSLGEPKKGDCEQPLSSGLTGAGFNVLLLLAFQNCSKNIL